MGGACLRENSRRASENKGVAQMRVVKQSVGMLGRGGKREGPEEGDWEVVGGIRKTKSFKG